ncbi:putative FAD-dependent monooxygenase [Podospora aff. communis PSN243]|uniref:FAD-dependent monooxygenase n=1 Tax=Podospora aff. communis PSN243 TaxID=3040156 RepID=A0AAV9H424_9PEZI|nr:putative FAD-dependent monooxygenase [Podospora aff. communis PSN243]
MSSNENTVIIVGAGVSGLLLAQYLQKCGIPYQVFERDADLTTRGVGWGLTLHWSLPAVRQLLPEELLRRIPETYVDRASVEKGLASTFPFFDLSTGELNAATPAAPESQRIRMSRQRFRELIATGIDIQWSKGVASVDSKHDSVTAHFDDGSSVIGRLLVACDGGNSRIRRALFPERPTYRIPIGVMGVKAEYTPEQMQPLQKLDPVFLQGTASANDTYAYFSVLDSPGNHSPGTQANHVLQIVISWPFRSDFLNKQAPTPLPATKEESLKLIQTFVESWAEPFRFLANHISPDSEIKNLELYDWLPPKEVPSLTNIALIGDAFHPMSMYRGEGANHAIVDVLELVETVIPHLASEGAILQAALHTYQNAVATRARPGVLASRQACLDAHDWSRISRDSPLLSRRAMKLDFDDSAFD